MCGIVGVSLRRAAVTEGLLRKMCDVIRHRGPDDEGTWVDPTERVGLGHRRLSIIDLSSAGHQPMADKSGLRIVFNGEIYNHEELRSELRDAGCHFSSGTDTEVILHSYRVWGAGCLDRLVGMFAFSIYDPRQEVLFVARDRIGEKPLFYHHTVEGLRFASELKALMQDPSFPRTLDLEALQFYLAYGYVPSPRCIIAGVQKLPPGHAFLYNISDGTMRTWRYWDLPEQSPHILPVEEVEEQFETLLTDAVRRQLIADVPVGVLLSGGLDSSVIAALAAKVATGSVKTFTISFPGEGAYDEGPYARSVAEYLGTEHTELAAEPASVDLLFQLAAQYDEPLADSSMVPTFMVSRLIRQHATVALGGDGGDELFGGYHHYSWIQGQDAIRRWLPSSLRRGVGAIARRLPVGVRGKNHLVALGQETEASISHVNLLFDAHARDRILREDLAPRGDNLSPEAFKASLCAGQGTTLRKAMAVDFRTYLPEDVLVKVDRASMLTSLEVRAPFLDHRVVEFAYRHIHDDLRVVRATRKIVLQRLARRILPPGHDLSRKRGFSLPLARWFGGVWGRTMEDVLCGADQRLFEPKAVEALFTGQRRGLTNVHRLFALTIFEIWRQTYKVTLP